MNKEILEQLKELLGEFVNKATISFDPRAFSREIINNSTVLKFGWTSDEIEDEDALSACIKNNDNDTPSIKDYYVRGEGYDSITLYRKDNEYNPMKDKIISILSDKSFYSSNHVCNIIPDDEFETIVEEILKEL